MASSLSPTRLGPGSRIALLAVIAIFSLPPLMAAELTIDRLFDAPALAGPSPIALRISPNGSRVTYLQGKAGNKDQLDLWEYNIQDRESRILIDSAVVATAQDRLSDEEINRRERQRTAALSGILEYNFAPTGEALLFPLNGGLFYYDLTRQGDAALTRIAGTADPVTDATVSSRSNQVAFIRNQNLFVYDLLKHKERALSHDGGGPIKNGMAEFAAQEEMDRSTGYWWSPDGTHIAFIRVDESPIKITQRFEIAADNVSTFSQRYPVAGGANVQVRLGVADVKSGKVIWMDLGTDTDIYLARVNWLPDSKTIAIQRESRDQRRLDLLFADIRSGQTRQVLTELSPSWIELNDDLTFLRNTSQFVWASNRDGFTHLYLYDYNGHELRQLTQGDWCVDDFHARAVRAIDEKNRTIYFMATEKSPVERHLYRASLDTTDPHHPVRISQESGVHSVAMSPDLSYFVDTFSSSIQPTQVRLQNMDGTLRTYLSENRLNETHPDFPFLADNSLPEYGTIPASDGQLLYYRVFKPSHFDAKKRYPAIVDVYGGPGVQRVVDTWTGSSLTQILTRAGYVVFQLDNRGTASRGTAFQSPIYGKLADVEVRDQVDGARWLATQSYVNGKEIGVWGWSYGGYMTLMLMFKAPDVFRAGVAGAPVTDWSLYDTHYTERYLGKPQDNADGYAASSVIPYAKDLKGHLLVIHGMADDNVLFLHSTKLFRKLQDLGKPFDVMVYPGAKHGLIRQHDGRHAYSKILEFFDRELAGKI